MRRSAIVKIAFKILITLGLVAILFWKVDWNLFREVLAEASFSWVFFAVLFYLGLLCFPAWSLSIFFRHFNVGIRIVDIGLINLKSAYYGLIFPGDVMAMTYRVSSFTRLSQESLSERKAEMGAVLAAVMADRILNIAALFLPILVLLLTSPLPDRNEWFEKLMIGLSVGVLFFFYLATRKEWRWLLSKVPNRLSRVRRMGETLLEAFQDIPPSVLCRVWLIHSVYQVVTLLAVDFLFGKSLGIHIPLFSFMTIVALVRLLRFVPITLSGIGTREALYPLLFKAFGVSYEKALLLGTLGSLMTIFLAILGGVFILFGSSKPQRDTA